MQPEVKATVELIVSLDFLPRLKAFLDINVPRIQKEAAWAIINIAVAGVTSWDKILQLGIDKSLLNLVDTKNLEVTEDVTFILSFLVYIVLTSTCQYYGKCS